MPRSSKAPSGPEMDAYSRSSGAAWSMAARRYFRRGDADLPSRGAFIYRGTQVVTGAEARQVAEEEARRRSAADDLLRSRPGTKTAPRQAFDHTSRPRKSRRADNPAQTPPQRNPEETLDAASSTVPPADHVSSQQAVAATRPAAASTRESAAVGSRPSATPHADWRASTEGARVSSSDASIGASALVGAVAALLVTTPIVLLSGVVFSHPIEPLFVALVLILAALSGGVAAAAWEAGRRRDRPG